MSVEKQRCQLSPSLLGMAGDRAAHLEVGFTFSLSSWASLYPQPCNRLCVGGVGDLRQATSALLGLVLKSLKSPNVESIAMLAICT